MFTQHNTPEKYIKNYVFDYDFGRPWGRCNVTMTSVLGHLTSAEFPPDFKNWQYPPPERLFDAPVKTIVSEVGRLSSYILFGCLSDPPFRTRKR